ncbi:MAG: NYN domain-containing protein [Acidobacteriota bacterium]
MAPWWLGSNVDQLEEAEAPVLEDASETSTAPDDGHEPTVDARGEVAKKGRRRRRRRGGGQGDSSEAKVREAPDDPSTASEGAGSPARSERPAPEEPSRRSDGRRLSRDDEADLDDDLVVPGGVVYVPERSQGVSDERKIAMFLDYENLALGVRDSATKSFEVGLILERLLEKGKIVVKRAYADWERYADAKRPLHEAAIELIDIPHKRYSGKNSADIKMVVDAIDLCYSKDHLDTFVLVTGDSDFSPLVSKLKENDKYVIGFGVKNSTSHLLIDNCDEFIYYEDVWRDTQRAPRLDHLPAKQAELFKWMGEALLALFREGKDVIWGSQLKQTMKRKRPSFSEGYYGYSTFSELLEDAQKKNVLRLRRDRRSGGYLVTGFAPRSKR